uniref:Peptidase M13 C-terminal domain-containing protein n=1 Tax=Romanomermis culicivorax TaxID=13658 RepID=A0A915IB14_ROMCU
MAYKFATQTMGTEPLLDDLLDYTSDQIFFISMARTWCSSDSKTAYLLENDEHSPPKARIERSLSNFRAFAKTFNCPMGSKYAPIKTCSLWGNFWEPA